MAMISSSLLGVPAEPSPIPSIGSDDEESFVVLGSSITPTPEDLSPEPALNTSILSNAQDLVKEELSMLQAASQDKSVSVSTATVVLSPETSYEEVPKRIEELMKENESLRNVISQNNANMKMQQEKILSWKEEIDNTYKANKEKIMNAKTRIIKLEEENSKLNNDVEKYKKIKELQDEEILNLKQRLKEAFTAIESVSYHQQTNVAQYELEIATTKVKDLEKTLQEMEANLSKLTEDNERLIKQLANNPDSDREQKSMQNEIERLTLELQLKTSEVEEKKWMIDRDSYSKLLEEKEGLKKSLEETRSAFEDKNKEILLLRVDLANYREMVDREVYVKLLEETELLKKSLEGSRSALEVKSNEVLELKDDLVSLQDRASRSEMSFVTEIGNLKGQLQAFLGACNPNLTEQNEHLKQQLMHSQGALTALKEEISSKALEIEKLRLMLQEAGSKEDEIFALNEQLALYKNDFDAERESKNNIKSERDQLAEDLQNLQRRNQQLQEEIEVVRPQGEMYRSQEEMNRPRQQEPSPGSVRGQRLPAKTDYKCPKCSFGFRSYQSLENHVHRCLDLEGFP